MKNFIALFSQGKERLPDLGSIHWLAYSIRKGKFSERILREYARKLFKEEIGVRLKLKELNELIREIIKNSQGEFLDKRRKHDIR